MPDTSTLEGVVILAIEAVLALGVYIWTSVALGRVFTKLGSGAWKAWLPIVNAVTIFRLGSLSALWVIALFFPVVSIAALVVFYYAIHAINQRFGRGIGYTILAILIFPVWASALGFGSRRPVETPAVAPYTARVEALQQQPAPTFAPVAEPVEAPTPVAFAPVAEPVEAPAPPPPPVVPVPATDLDPDLERTVIRSRVQSAWTLTSEAGQSTRLRATTIIVGRAPVASAQYPDAQLIAVTDPSKTISKTHARLTLADEVWSIVDLASTNGVMLVLASGAEIEIVPGMVTKLTPSFKLGELGFTLGAGS